VVAVVTVVTELKSLLFLCFILVFVVVTGGDASRAKNDSSHVSVAPCPAKRPVPLLQIRRAVWAGGHIKDNEPTDCDELR
jgi:hypothetical protein